MAVPDLITTPGSFQANSYATLEEAEVYFEASLHNNWSDVSEDNRKKALLTSTRLLDLMFNWDGFKKTKKQFLRWPRIGVKTVDGFHFDSDEIPIFLKNATIEYAKFLLVEDRTAEDDTKGFSRIKVGSIELEIDKTDRKKAVPESILDLIMPYGTLKSKINTKVVRR